MLFLILCFYIALKMTDCCRLDWEQSQIATERKEIQENFLDRELCYDQIDIIKNNSTLLQRFLDSGLRLPRGITEGNLLDLGSYFQCLGINEDLGSTTIEGKYCIISVPINQDMRVFKSIGFVPGIAERLTNLQRYLNGSAIVRTTYNLPHFTSPYNKGLKLRLAVCVPKSCTTFQWLDAAVFDSEVGLAYADRFCRTDDDTLWAPADYVALIVFSILGCLTLLSTCYDIRNRFFLKTDPEHIDPLWSSFSLYTNGRRLMSFTEAPDSLPCLDGIRVIFLGWIILGHAIILMPVETNVIEFTFLVLSVESTWLSASPIAVDTFFALSGLLLVYTAAQKFTGKNFLRNLPLLYLHRYLRLFPLLASAVLLQASLLLRLASGPAHTSQLLVAVDRCRASWWTTLLYIQTYTNPQNVCVLNSWYLAVDMHMYLLSPLFLFWVVRGQQKTAWLALSVGLLCFLVLSTIYNFVNKFPAALLAANRVEDYEIYLVYYYVNTLTRGSSFIVGMFFGYYLHLRRGEAIILSKCSVLLVWIVTLMCLSVGVMASHPMKSFDWDDEVADALINSFSKPIWAAGVGLTVVACVQGYGGPVNWLLCLQLWKLPSRLSYAVYLFHFQVMLVTTAAATAPVYKTPLRIVFDRFIGDLTIAVFVSYLMTLFVDSPFTTVFKLMLAGSKRSRAEKAVEVRT